jgi:hypothetical protein
VNLSVCRKKKDAIPKIFGNLKDKKERTLIAFRSKAFQICNTAFVSPKAVLVRESA